MFKLASVAAYWANNVIVAIGISVDEEEIAGVAKVFEVAGKSVVHVIDIIPQELNICQ